VKAAHIADTFKLDPIMVLRSGRRDWLIREACALVVAEAKAPVDKA
jgi:hypothetical protein